MEKDIVMTKIKPLIKWAGGKYRLSEQILPLIESHYDLNSFDTYVEPFLGGGGMLFAVLNQHTFANVIVSDINGELINMYVQVRDSPTAVIGGLRTVEAAYRNFTSEEERKGFYLSLREDYNAGILKKDRTVWQAVLFIALNKLCFNGLYRVNQSGLFNVPFGKKTSVNLADYENISNVSKRIQGIKFIEGGFESSLPHAKPGAFYYFDSPYRPVSKTEAFTSYAKSSFNDDSQRKLASMTAELASRGARFALSNSDPMDSPQPDRFFVELYSHGVIEKVNARRAIGASSLSRKTVSEILVLG